MELSSLSIHYLVQEFQVLVGGKIDKLFQEDNITLIPIHIPNSDKKYLEIHLPGLIFLNNEKRSISANNFALAIRKHINNLWIKNIHQIQFERIIVFEFNNNKRLYIEMFRPGNIILCLNSKIIMAKTYRSFGSREIRPGIEYVYPKKKYNIFDLDEKKIVTLLKESDKDSIVVILALELGLGGLFAEEVLSHANINKKKNNISSIETKRLLIELKKLFDKKPDPCIIYDGDQAKEVIPYPILKYSNCQKIKSISEGLSSLPRENKINNKPNRKLESIIKKQTMQLDGLNIAYKDNKQFAEIIYKNYQFLQSILVEIKKHNFSHPAIVSVDKKNKKITVEL